jgi:uncharacterized protein
MAGLPPRAGAGLKPAHYRDILERAPDGLWLEVHPENYMVDGGPRLAWLEALRLDRALSFHGVGASLGGLDPFDPDHLARLVRLIERFEPEQVSEHAAWSAHAGRYLADLLPLPRTGEALRHLALRVEAFQNTIGRRILIENPTNYLPFRAEVDEPDFLCEIAQRAGCGLLMDVNNIWISANNIGGDPHDYVRAIPGHLVGEIHVAGHSPDPQLGGAFLIDSHAEPVSDDVWSLLAFALATWGPRPVLVERDADIPSFRALMDERTRADTLIGSTSPAQPHAA